MRILYRAPFSCSLSVKTPTHVSRSNFAGDVWHGVGEAAKYIPRLTLLNRTP